jgi:16S rRNA (cytosine1402-N4)-methyltransferase
MAAERVLKTGGLLASVTFHSIEDRMVKRFFQEPGAKNVKVNRYASEQPVMTQPFEILTRKAVGPDKQELAENPRSRSAKLRVARRTLIDAREIDSGEIAMPLVAGPSKYRKT